MSESKRCPEHDALTCPDCGRNATLLENAFKIIKELQYEVIELQKQLKTDSTWRLQALRKPS